MAEVKEQIIVKLDSVKFNAKKLSEFMEKKDLSQTDIATKLGINPTTVHYILKERNKCPRVDVLVGLAKLLECNMEELIIFETY